MRRFFINSFVHIKLAYKVYCLRKIPGVYLSNGVSVDLYTFLEPHVSIGQGCNISSSKLGFGTYLADHAYIRHTSVGRFCSIADNVRTGNGTHPTKIFVSTHPAFYSPLKQAGFSFVNYNLFDEMPSAKKTNYVVDIGNDVYIGSGSRILDGITIGDGAIIGAGSIVTKDIEPFSVNVGVPARRLHYRFNAEYIDFLLNFKWWDRDMKWLSKNSELFMDIEKFYEYYKNDL